MYEGRKEVIARYFKKKEKEKEKEGEKNFGFYIELPSELVGVP